MVGDDGVLDGAARQAADNVKHFLVEEKVAGWHAAKTTCDIDSAESVVP
jgi:hypothetical protein